MNRRWHRGVVLLLLIVVLAVGALLWPKSTPSYKGKSVDAWIDSWAAHDKSDYYHAFQEMGTNALPYAVRNLAKTDSYFYKTYRDIYAKTPQALRKLLTKPKPLLQTSDGANIFYYTGSNSIPFAIASLKHRSTTVRQVAAYGIGAVRRQYPAAAEAAIPALIEALDDRDYQVRFYAGLSFKEFGPAASNAVPALTKVLAYTGSPSEAATLANVRAVVAVALGKIGPAASSAIPELKRACADPSYYLRGQAAVALWRVSGDTETALPILLTEMAHTSEHEKWDWIIAVGEMGPRAKSAIPQLEKELSQDREKWARSYVTNALAKVKGEVPFAKADGK